MSDWMTAKDIELVRKFDAKGKALKLTLSKAGLTYPASQEAYLTAAREFFKLHGIDDAEIEAYVNETTDQFVDEHREQVFGK